MSDIDAGQRTRPDDLPPNAVSRRAVLTGAVGLVAAPAHLPSATVPTTGAAGERTLPATVAAAVATPATTLVGLL